MSPSDGFKFIFPVGVDRGAELDSGGFCGLLLRLMSTDPASIYSRKKPFPAPHEVNRRLSGSSSQKETRHHEISLAGSGLRYEVGDSLGVFASNDPALVEEILGAIGASGEEAVNTPDGGSKGLREAMLSDFIITTPSKEFLAALVAKGGDATADLAALTGDAARKKELDAYLWGREVVDFLLAHPQLRWSAEEFAKTLRKLQPRLYSIASSQKAVGEAVHLTIATVRYESFGRQRSGVASTFLADRTAGGVTVPVFVHTAKHFRLPEDPATPVIMVGPGTGVAPFRAYLQERKALGGGGKNWLFFGEQRRESDFLYGDELGALQTEGVLTRLDLAFSRDQEQKVYVQHRMREASAELYAWLEAGAHFFVCGDGERMAKDVDAELHAIVAREKGCTPEVAAEYVDALKKSKRYKKDVY
jgi:sulfite reductase (NADPH) flavoprotein alpha-component